MGFHSYNCKSCGESVKAPYDLPESMAWQNEVIIVIDENTRYEGSYDGYGGVNIADPEVKKWPEMTVTKVKLAQKCLDLPTNDGWGTPVGVWHKKCFEEDCTLKGADYLLVDYKDLATPNAHDQGYWYDRPEGEETLERPIQRPDADGRVDTRLMHPIDAAESFEKPEMVKSAGSWIWMSPQDYWRHLRDADWSWWDHRDDEERVQRGADERVRLREYASQHRGEYWELFKAFSRHWGYDNMQAVIHADWGGPNSTRERRARPALPLEPQE